MSDRGRTDYVGREAGPIEKSWSLICPRCGRGFWARLPTKRRFYRITTVIKDNAGNPILDENGNEQRVEAMHPELVIPNEICSDCRAGRKRKEEFKI